MRLKLYRARSVTEAMAQVRAELGADALILSTRRTADGIELTAALDPDYDPPALKPATLSDTSSLAWHGLPPDVAARLSEGPLAATLQTLLRFSDLPLSGDGPPLLLVGPPGAGKTLTTARLATRLVLVGQRPLVITADGRRAGAAEELAAYTRLLGISLVVASHPATLARALQHRIEGAPVLIDTTGASAFCAQDMEALAALAATAHATPLLVMPAGQDPHEAADQACAFAEAGARYLLPTRLDLARRLGGIVTAAAAGSLALTEAGTGPGASDGLTPLTPEFLAARLSRTISTALRTGPA